MKTTRCRLAIILIIMVISSFSMTAQTHRGEKSLGPVLGYVTRNNSATAGVAFRYCFSNTFRVAPQAAIIFRNQNKDGIAVNINAEFPIDFAKGKMSFYPLVGVGYTSWNRHGIDPENSDDVTSHINGLNLNGGAGLEVYATKSFRINLEAMYSLMRHYPTAYITAGISYIF